MSARGRERVWFKMLPGLGVGASGAGAPAWAGEPWRHRGGGPAGDLLAQPLPTARYPGGRGVLEQSWAISTQEPEQVTPPAQTVN